MVVDSLVYERNAYRIELDCDYIGRNVTKILLTVDIDVFVSFCFFFLNWVGPTFLML